MVNGTALAHLQLPVEFRLMGRTLDGLASPTSRIQILGNFALIALASFGVEQFLRLNGTGLADELVVDDKHLAKARLACPLGHVEHLARTAGIALLGPQIVDGGGRAVEALLLVVAHEGQVRRAGGEVEVGRLLQQVGLVLYLVARAVVPVAHVQVVLIILLLLLLVRAVIGLAGPR